MIFNGEKRNLQGVIKRNMDGCRRAERDCRCDLSGADGGRAGCEGKSCFSSKLIRVEKTVLQKTVDF